MSAMEHPAFSNSAFPEYPLDQLVSPDNIQRWTSVYGDQAQAWLNALPAIVHDYAEKWELTIEEPLEGGTVSAVIGARQHDEHTVLKIHPPWLIPVVSGKTSAETEAAAFGIWGGQGAPRLLANDTRGLLLERIIDAHHSPDMDAADMADLVSRIDRVLSLKAMMLGIPPIMMEIEKRFGRAAAKGHPEISMEVLLNARNIASHLCSYPLSDGVNFPRSTVLVHGDLKIKNVLERPDGTKYVVDPSPAIGNPLYDATLWTIDKPEGIADRCDDMAYNLEINPRIIGNLAVALAVSEVCLASPARAAATLEYVRDFAGTSDLQKYFFDEQRTFDTNNDYLLPYNYGSR